MATVAVNTALIDPTPAESLAPYWFSPDFSSSWQPGMHFCRTAGSVRAWKTLTRGALSLWMPSIFMGAQSSKMLYGYSRNRLDLCLGQGRCNLAAHPGFRYHLLRIQQRLRIEHVAQPRHHFEVIFGEHERHQVHLLASHAVLPGNRAAHAHAIAHDFLGGLSAVLGFARILAIEQDQWVKVSIAGVKNIPDGQVILLADALDLGQRFGNPGARDNAILGVIRRGDASDGAEGGLASQPEQVALLLDRK